MKCNVHRDAFRSAAVVLVFAALIVPSAHAQMHFGGPARVPQQAGPLSLQSGAVPHQQLMPALQMPLIGPAAIGTATTTNLFAQVAIGGGYTTIFTFLNTGLDAATGNLILTGDLGAPLNASFTSPGSPSAVNSSFPISVPSGGAQLITAGPVNASDPTSTGWARVESSGGSLGGVATFQLAGPTGALTTIVGVLSAATTNAATIPVDDDLTQVTQSRSTGYAIANTGTSAINVKIVLVNPDGTISQTINPGLLNPLLPGNHIARFVWQDVSPSFVFKGSMVLIETAAQPFSVVALVFNQNLFTAIPVIPGKAPGIQ